MFGTYNFTATSVARRLALGGVAAAALLGLAACQPTTTAGPAASSAAPAPGGSSTSPGSGQNGNAPTSAPAAGGTPVCSGGQIKVTTASQGGAMTHRGSILIFTNMGNSACSMSGYPGASLPNSSGTTWNAARTMAGYMGGAQGYSSPPTVIIAPGDSASAILEWDAAPAGGAQPDNANCPGLDSVHLLVTPPNTQSTTTFAPLPDACTEFQIHPVVAGSTGQGQA